MRASEEYVAETIEAAMLAATSGLDLATIGQIISLNLQNMLKLSQELGRRDLTDPKQVKTQEIPKMIGYSAKMIDETFRMVQYAKGNPDGRPEGGAEWLSALTDAQFRQLKQWVAEAKDRG